MDMMQSRDSARPHFVPRSRIGRASVALLCAVIAFLGAKIIRQFLLWDEESVWPGAPDSRTHSRPIVERDGHRLLWARGDSEADEAEWFDVTDSRINPERFQYGIASVSERSLRAASAKRAVPRGAPATTNRRRSAPGRIRYRRSNAGHRLRAWWRRPRLSPQDSR